MAKDNGQGGNDRGQQGGGRGGRGGRQQQREPRSKLYDEDVIRINRVDKVVSGGRRSSFSFVVLGNSKGKAFAQAKAVENSIDKAVRLAEKTSALTHR